MQYLTTPLDPTALAQLQGLELRARHIVDGLQPGMHRSARRGQSVEFAEHRDYAPGDDLRYLDWKVLGKTDKAYLKQYEAETSLMSYVLLDVSESMQYQSEHAALSKLEYAQCLAASIAYLVLRQRDRVGLATFDESICQWIDGRDNPAHLHELIDAMQCFEGTGKSDFRSVLHAFLQRAKHRGVIVLISDLLADASELLAGLQHLRHARHEVIVLQVLDSAELEFSFEHATRFEGLESLSHVLAEPRGLRRAYLNAVAAFLERVKIGCQSHQIEYHVARTDEAPAFVLRRALAGRKRR